MLGELNIVSVINRQIQIYQTVAAVKCGQNDVVNAGFRKNFRTDLVGFVVADSFIDNNSDGLGNGQIQIYDTVTAGLGGQRDGVHTGFRKNFRTDGKIFVVADHLDEVGLQRIQNRQIQIYDTVTTRSRRQSDGIVTGGGKTFRTDLKCFARTNHLGERRIQGIDDRQIQIDQTVTTCLGGQRDGVIARRRKDFRTDGKAFAVANHLC